MKTIEEADIHWLVYKHEHNDWTDECKPELVAIFSSYDTAKKKQQELLDRWAKDVCMDNDDEVVINYDTGRATFRKASDDYFQVIIEKFSNKERQTT